MAGSWQDWDVVISSPGWRLSTKGVCSNGAYRYKTLCKTATPAPPAIQVTHSCSPLCIPVQDGDTYPDFPEDGDLPEGEAEVKARIEAATAIKGRGNELFKQVRGGHSGQGRGWDRGFDQHQPQMVSQQLRTSCWLWCGQAWCRGVLE